MTSRPARPSDRPTAVDAGRAATGRRCRRAAVRPAADRTGAAHRPAQPADGAGRTASAAVERADRSAGRSTATAAGAGGTNPAGPAAPAPERRRICARRASSYLRSLLFTVRPASVWPGNRRSTPSGKRSSPGCNTSWRTRVSNSNSTRRSCRKWSGSTSWRNASSVWKRSAPCCRAAHPARCAAPPATRRWSNIRRCSLRRRNNAWLRCAPSPRNCKPGAPSCAPL